MGQNNSKNVAILIAIGIISLLGLINSFSLFKNLNDVSYDALVTTIYGSPSSKKLVIINADHSSSTAGDEVWLSVLNELLAHNVEQIVFGFLPTQVSNEFYQRAAKSAKVIFGQTVTYNNASELKLEAIPLAAENSQLHLGLVSRPENESGVYRSQVYTIDYNGNQLPSLALLTAQRVMDKPLKIEHNQYLVNFSSGQRRLPEVSLKRVLEKGLVDELVAGRTVLIGIRDLDYQGEFYTPISSEVGLIPPFIFQAFALESLLSDSAIMPWNKWIDFGLVIVITLISTFIYQSLSFRLSLILTVILSLAYIALAWLLLHQLSTRIPFMELIFTQWLNMAFISGYRMAQDKKELDGLLLDLSVKLQDKVFPISFYSAEDPWEQLIIMINQTLNLNRLIFLERVVGDHRLKEIKAFNCSIDDVVEMRRDYERSPYSTAISENQPILLTNPYLTDVDVEEQVYMAPLMFAGDILGFWVFTAEPHNIASQSRFINLARDYMVQVSEVLHYRQEWQKRVKAEGNTLLKYMRVQGGKNNFQVLSKSISLLEQRMSELQEVFNNLSDAHVLYDLFGRVILVNTPMESMAKKSKLQPYNMTVLDFITQLTGIDIIKARSMLQVLIFEQEEMSFPVDFFDNGRDYLLRVKPMLMHEDTAGSIMNTDEVSLFQLRGILCELVDITELKKVSELKENMLQQFSYRIRNDIGTLSLGLPMLEESTLSNDDKGQVLSTISEKVDTILNTINLVNKQVDADSGQLIYTYPVDALFATKNALDSVNEDIQNKQIHLHLQLPNFVSLVLAEHAELEKLLITILEMMIEDTYDHGNLWMTIVELEKGVSFKLHNTGVGLHEEAIKLYMDDSNSSSDVVKLQLAVRHAKQWGGQLQLSSDLGQGTQAELTLTPFMQVSS